MRVFVPTVCLALLSILPPQGRGKAPATSTSENVKALVSRQYTALAEGNARALQDLYAEGGQLVFFPIASGPTAGAPGHLRAIDEFRKGANVRWPPAREVHVLPIGTSGAVSTTTFNLQGSTASGQPVAFEGRHTGVWQRSGGQWRIVHEHFSAPWSAPALPPTPVANAGEIVAGVLRAYENAWSAADAAALAALWDQDGDIGTLGSPAATTGRAAVTEFWTQSIARRRSSSPTLVTAKATTARSLAHDAIVADGTFEYRPKNASTTAAAASTDRFAMTLKETKEGWRIASLRITR